MAELKTKKNERSVESFLSQISDDQRQQDCRVIVKLMQQATKSEPKMWGTSIVGFGDYRYRYASGREGDWFLTGFSPRKQNLSLYLMANFEERDELLRQLGKHSTGKGCLYVKRLADIDLSILKKLIQLSIRALKKNLPT